jgi:hypothetical protein
MPKRVTPYTTVMTRTLLAVTLGGLVCVCVPPKSLAYKIEMNVSAPIGGDSVSEENGRTEIQLDTGPVIGPGGETGSAYAAANLATGSLGLKVSATSPDQSTHSGMGLSSNPECVH